MYTTHAKAIVNFIRNSNLGFVLLTEQLYYIWDAFSVYRCQTKKGEKVEVWRQLKLRSETKSFLNMIIGDKLYQFQLLENGTVEVVVDGKTVSLMA